MLTSGNEDKCDAKNVLTCPLCKFIATKSSSIKLHQIVHTTKKPYICSECEYKTSVTSSFNRHILTHYNDKPHICIHCNTYFAETAHLTRHMRSQHPSTIIKCNNCDYSTFLPSEISKHRERCISTNKNLVILTCPLCTFIATKECSLELHHIVHTTNGPYSSYKM